MEMRMRIRARIPAMVHMVTCKQAMGMFFNDVIWFRLGIGGTRMRMRMRKRMRMRMRKRMRMRMRMRIRKRTAE